MTATLVKGPVRMSPSMLTGGTGAEAAEADRADAADEVAGATEAEAGSRPLAYLYADWQPAFDGPVPADRGHYDPDTQTWVVPPGTINAGNWTYCRGGAGGWEWVVDDACV
jgi:hypothetical protein